MEGQEEVRKGFALRLSKSLENALRASAAADGVSIHHFVQIAVTEKLARLQIEASLRDVRASSGEL